MTARVSRFRRVIAATLAFALLTPTATALAGDRHHGRGDYGHRGGDVYWDHPGNRGWKNGHHKHDRHPGYGWGHPRDVVVIHKYDRRHRDYRRHNNSNDALAVLGVAALGLVILNELSQNQARAYENATLRATRAPIGERIVWEEDGAYGQVTPTRSGRTPSGMHCREFQQQISVGGRVEEGYGTACLQPDGSWQIVSN